MIREATEKDFDSVMLIYERARNLMKTTGNPNQWINGYPEEWLVRKDIEKKTSYVCEMEGRIEAVFVFLKEGDPAYQRIYEGYWLNNKPYGAIHRVASAGNISGITSEIFTWCYKQIRNLKIDTHHENKIMQHVLEKNGFVRCGLIYLENGAERIAYQKE